MEYYSVDQISGGTALLLNEEEQPLTVPIEALARTDPPIREGETVVLSGGVWVRDDAETARRRALNAALLARVLHRAPAARQTGGETARMAPSAAQTTQTAAQNGPVTLRDLFAREQYIILDGGMGTMLQAAGMPAGTNPALLAVTDPALPTGIHAEYAAAGARLLCANTFGASPHKLAGTGHTIDEVIPAALACARRAAAPYGALVALDVGPLGELLAPAGSLSFEDAYAEYAAIIEAGKQDADLVFFETMTDLYELKAALLAAKEHCGLPVLASMTFEANGRSFTGCCVESFAAVAVGLGADAVGINCSLGPKEIYPLARRLCAAVPGEVPVFMKPNAGLPHADGSGYDLTAGDFCEAMEAYKALGVSMVGGCCGTTPEFIRLLAGRFAGEAPAPKKGGGRSMLCTPVRAVEVRGITVVGERLNPTGKKRFQQALRTGDMDYLAAQAVEQAEAGAQLLDLNVGMPGVDEPALMEAAVRAVQAVTDLPLQLDSADPEALARGLRAYNGKPIVNSVNGEAAVLERILPLCKRYGAAVVGLTLDENGIPPTAGGRLAIAKRIRDAALAAGIPREDIYIDCLTLTASAEQAGAAETLRAAAACKKELGVRTLLGISNISFGLPCREVLNTSFLTLAMAAGADLVIFNPASAAMMAAVASFRVLTAQDEGSAEYVARYAGAQVQTQIGSGSGPAGAGAAAAPGAPAAERNPLAAAVEQGLRAEAAAAARALLESTEPLELVNGQLIPALDAVGEGFEAGRLFLPQLLSATGAAQAAFEEVRRAMAARGTVRASRGRIVLATVQGDVHDIGKNIVRVVLENYGYEVEDLGRDVPPEAVVAAVRRSGAPLVGLSALMTTTLPAMQTTIAALRAAGLGCRVMVGGAVLTPDYARRIGADYYAKDAKASADIARQVLGR